MAKRKEFILNIIQNVSIRGAEPISIDVLTKDEFIEMVIKTHIAAMATQDYVLCKSNE